MPSRRRYLGRFAGSVGRSSPLRAGLRHQGPGRAFSVATPAGRRLGETGMVSDRSRSFGVAPLTSSHILTVLLFRPDYSATSFGEGIAMSRRKHLVARGASGRPQRIPRPEPLSPTESRRLLDAASSGMRDPVWATILGQIYLRGKISASEFSAGKFWAELTANYSVACQSPSRPRTRPLDAAGGRPADPDSEAGIREARRHEKASAAFVEARCILKNAGREAERVVESICIHDQVPAGFAELEALRVGLSALSHWLTQVRRKAR